MATRKPNLLLIQVDQLLHFLAAYGHPGETYRPIG